MSRLEEIKKFFDENILLVGRNQPTRKHMSALIAKDNIDWLISRVEELEQEREQDPRQGMLEDLHMENQRYKQALEFYADIYNHETLLDNEHEFTFIEMDKGEKARQALKGASK